MENVIICRECDSDLDFAALEANLPFCLACRQAFVLKQLGRTEFRRKKSPEERAALRKERRAAKKSGETTGHPSRNVL
jgi:hypothetical protein